MTDANSAARVYQRIVPRPVRAVAGSRVPPRVRRKVKGGLVRTLNRREARLHQRALRLVRKGDFASASERRTRTPTAAWAMCTGDSPSTWPAASTTTW